MRLLIQARCTTEHLKFRPIDPLLLLLTKLHPSDDGAPGGIAMGELTVPLVIGSIEMVNTTRRIIVRFYGVIPLVQSDDVFGPVEAFLLRFFFFFLNALNCEIRICQIDQSY